jgi:hypothetical protein
VEIEFHRFTGDLGAGGESLEVSFKMGADSDIVITKIPCRGGPGTMYKVFSSTPHYRPYSFFQLIREDLVNPAADDIEFWVKPGDVKDILAPEFAELPLQVRAILEQAEMLEGEQEDSDLTGEAGESLYDKLGSLRKACLLNIAKKAAHVSSDNCLPQIEALLLCRQDRFFAFVDMGLADRLQSSPLYKTAPDSLHKPLPGFKMTGQSFKSRDAHANLQVTFMQHIESGRMAADIDIDESSGIEHGFEVIGNALFRKRTNPYLIREFMLSADLQNRSLDPGYSFVF